MRLREIKISEIKTEWLRKIAEECDTVKDGVIKDADNEMSVFLKKASAENQKRKKAFYEEHTIITADGKRLGHAVEMVTEFDSLLGSGVKKLPYQEGQQKTYRAF